jgi:hypothetical protein
MGKAAGLAEQIANANFGKPICLTVIVGDLYIGASSTLDAGSFFSGLIDDIRIRSAPLRTGSTTGR